MRAARWAMTAIAFLCVASASPLCADPLVVTGGRVQVLGRDGVARINLRGDGFRLSTSTEDFVAPIAQLPVELGTPVSLDGLWHPADLRGGSLNWHGVDYPDVHFGVTTSGATFLAGSVTATHLGYTDIALPFTVTGVLTAYPSQDFYLQPPIFSSPFVGHGIARVRLLGLPGLEQPDIFEADYLPGRDYRLEYAFGDAAAVPEPATLVLVGSGVVAAVARRRRR